MPTACRPVTVAEFVSVGLSVGSRLTSAVHRGALRVIGLVVVVATMSVPALAQPIIVEEIVRNTPGGIVRGYIATVDLQDPRVSIVVTGQAAAGAGDSVLTTVPAWRTSVNADLAVNANYFSTLTGGRSDIIGLCVSDGVVVSPARQFDPQRADPALTISQSKIASIDYVSPSVTGLWDAVAGVGPSNTDTDPGTFLVTDGVNTGATARVTPATREPRTGVGVNKAGTTLYIAVVDGRQAGWSAGMTLAEFAEVFRQKGAWRAINLDGGGSTSWEYRQPGGTLVQNKPSDGVFRGVAAHLGVRVAAITNTDRVTRPIRGTWMRPVGSIGTGYPNGADLATFESRCATLAAAGIQDVFLETLFWGRDSGQAGQSNFPPRFGGTDYLAEAITRAAKYSIRVHAWCETGYLDFGTNPSAFLAANPSYVLNHVANARNAVSAGACTPYTYTGDLANQRFVNLGNPGVRSALNSYFQSLATNYPGLEGIQADYHFYALSYPTSTTGQTNVQSAAPWSFDSWALANFTDASGVSANPLSAVNTCNGVMTVNSSTGVVSAGGHPNWVNWNRQNVVDALVQLRASVEGVSGGPLFSCVSFGAWNSTEHTSKCIDLPKWGSLQGAEGFFIMAYQTTTNNISNELNLAQTALPNRRVVAGLANLTGATRPTITQQLDAMKTRGIQDFCWFDAPTFINNPSYLTQLRTWLYGSASPPSPANAAWQIGDINQDGYIDARDLVLFNAVYTGTPVTTTPSFARYDLNGDGVIDATDLRILRTQFRNFHFGDDGVVDNRDLRALQNCIGYAVTPVPTILHLYDLNGDGRVDYTDQLILHSYLTVQLPMDTDVDRNGVVNLEDLYTLARTMTIDVNRDGVIDGQDLIDLAAVLRASEAADITGGLR